MVLEGFELEEVKPDFNKEKQTEVIGYGDALNDRSELKNKGGGVGMMTRDINECLLAEEVETTEELPLTFNTLFFWQDALIRHLLKEKVCIMGSRECINFCQNMVRSVKFLSKKEIQDQARQNISGEQVSRVVRELDRTQDYQTLDLYKGERKGAG